jgi:hypothetical protein
VFNHPPYSLDISLCDFHMLSHLKKELKGHTFGSDADVKAVMVQKF